MNDEEKLAYYIRTADQQGKRAADLDRQLYTAWGHINDLGEMLRSNGLDAGSLTGHIDSLAAAIKVSAEIQVDAYNSFRMSVVGAIHAAEDAIEKKSAAKEAAFDFLVKRLRVLNAKVKDAGSQAEARRIVAERRAGIDELVAQGSLFEVSGG